MTKIKENREGKIIVIKCDVCEHEIVCSRREEYIKTISNIAKNTSKEILESLGFFVTLECENYKMKEESLKYLQCLNSTGINM